MNNPKPNYGTFSKAVTFVGAGILALSTQSAEANALEKYLKKPDAHFAWKSQPSVIIKGFEVTQIDLVSQQWRGHEWTHVMQVVRPSDVRNRDLAFLFITGDGNGREYLGMLQTLAERSGALAAVVTRVPNQPLYEGRREDALIAYTIDRYLRTGDETWPLLFPMVKSAVRAMDAVQEFAAKELGQKTERFVISGASKRGWTTWLSATVDERVQGIAPMVIDILNIPEQTAWAQRMYGHQSEQIRDYTQLNLIERMSEPAMVQLRKWIDPYEYRDRYTMPKLILLGTNDPYWVVDSLRHYWDGLPEPKLVFQTPNAGHDLAGGEQAIQTLAAWLQIIADRQELPAMNWEVEYPSSGTAQLKLKVTPEAKRGHLWTAESSDRDFRNDRWSKRAMELQSGSSKASVEVQKPEEGYRAFMGEVVLVAPTGHEYKLSTEARVVPDGKPKDGPQ